VGGSPTQGGPDRVGIVEALGLEETLFLRQGPWRRRMWITAAVDIRNSEQKMTGLLQAGDPRGEVQAAWRAKETLRGICQTTPHLPPTPEGGQCTRPLTAELQGRPCSPEVNQLGRTPASSVSGGVD